ncbi:MAG: protein kinase, partial [Candidatus Limnocylindrales bacterium]
MAEIGRMIGGRYRLQELLGEGSFATVYRARDVEGNRDVAVKLLRPEYAEDPDFMSDFRWQSRLAASVDHENVAAVYDLGSDRSGAYLVTEYVDGADLATLLERNGPVPPRRAARAAAEVARALQAAHDRGLPHGDLQPRNVMVTRDGHIKVTDFGIARAAAAVADVASANIKRHEDEPEAVTPTAVPGVRLGGAPSEASDVEALGHLLYEMLTGRAPWVGSTAEAVMAAREAGPPPRPSTLSSAVPAALDEIAMRALSPAPDWRYASAALVAEALESFVGGGAGGAVTAPARRPGLTAAGTSTPFRAGGAANIGTLAGAAGPAAAAGAAAAGAAGAGRTGHGAFSSDAYASGRGVVAELDSGDQSVDGYALEYARTRRAARRSGRLDLDESETSGASPWAWIAGMLGILLIGIIGLLVVLVSSLGSGPKAVSAPDLRNLTSTQAQQAAARLGLNIAIGFQANDGTHGENTVIAQDPPTGTQMHEGDTIAITVATGQGTVIVPDIVGKSENDARTALTSAGLSPGDRTEQY